jgi:hypothetical protein
MALKLTNHSQFHSNSFILFLRPIRPLADLFDMLACHAHIMLEVIRGDGAHLSLWVWLFLYWRGRTLYTTIDADGGDTPSAKFASS